MHVYLMGRHVTQLDQIRSHLLAAGWQSTDVHSDIDQNSLESALTAQEQAALLLDLSDGKDTSALTWLSEITRRRPRLQVILFSSQRDGDLLMQAMRSGAREVLNSPPDPDELVHTLQRLTPHAAESPRQDASTAPVLAFIASKGGNGATQLASNLAWLLALEFGRDSVLADLDLLYGDASFYLGGNQVRHSVDQLAQQVQRLDAQLLHSSLHPVHKRLHLLAAPTKPIRPQGITPAALARVLTLARQQHEVVILDLPHQPDDLALQALQLVDTVYIVMRGRVPDVRNTQRLMQLLHDHGIPVQRMQPLLNRADESGSLQATAMDKALSVPIVHRVANDPAAMQACMHLGKPLHEHSPGSPVLRDLRQLAHRSLGLPLPNRTGWIGRWLGKADTSSAI